MTKEQLENLLVKFFAGDITADEKTVLEKWISSNEGQHIFQYVQNEEWVKKGIAELDKIDTESAYAKFITKYNNVSAPLETGIKSPDGFQKKRWQWLAAAAIISVVCWGSFYFYPRSKSSAKTFRKETENLNQNILPGSNTATLQLSDGSTILLNQSSPGLLAEEGAVKVQKTADDQLVYNAVAKNQGPIEYFNSITTPAGGQYRLVLPDGSKVWLNAGSGIRFPVAFNGKERRVTITGEVYFDVVTGTNSTPFIVSIQKNSTAAGEVQVIGTRFNVNAYNDEGSVRTTVLEGRVSVVPSSASSKTIQLYSGQQAAYTGNGNIQVSTADTGSVAGWLQGKFIFQNEPIQSIMRQLGRWYNVDIIFRDDIDARFVASFPRDMQLPDLLRILEKTNIIRFEIRDKTVIVMR